MSNRFLIRAFFWLFASFLLNYFLRKHAGFPDAYAALLSYNQLYHDRNKMHIGQSRYFNDSLEITVEGMLPDAGNDAFDLIDEEGKILRSRGRKVRMKLSAGTKRQYRIAFPGYSDTIKLDLDKDPDYQKRKPDGSYEIVTNTLMGSDQLFEIRDWAMDYWGTDTVGISDQTRKILSDSIHVDRHDAGKDKILKIANFILQRTGKQDGKPDEELSHMHPLKQLRRVQEGKSKIWCGNYTAIFSWLASATGLPVRLISCGKPEGGGQNGVHVFCEAYLDEDRQWVYVDLTSRNIMVSYQRKWLNAIDVQRLANYKIRDTAWMALHFEKDSISAVPYADVSALTDHYFHANTVFNFYFSSYFKYQYPENFFLRIVKFFYPGFYYAVYSDNIRSPNYLFYLRLMSNYLLVICLAYFFFGMARSFRR